jgi:Bacterial extracellular solute-binding proteins, family 5 Middle
MFLTRVLLYLLPLLLALFISWTVTSMRSVSIASPQKDLIALLPSAQPLTLHPYSPATEVDTQIVKLLHLPLVTKSVDGQIVPGLATQWHWSKTVTLWFANAEQARAAEEGIQKQLPSKAVAWLLRSASQDNELVRLDFSDPTLANIAAVLTVIQGSQPQLLTVLRLQTSDASSRVRLSKLLSEPQFAKRIIRTWTGSIGEIEITIRSSSEAFAADIGAAYKAQRLAPPRLRRLTSFFALEEPVLSFTLDPVARSCLGEKLTTEDVRQTYLALHRQPSLMATPRSGLHAIDRVEPDASSPGIVRVVYRRFYGPALCDWIDLPILPATWWQAHQNESVEAAFLKEKVPGYGPLQIESRSRDSLILKASSISSNEGFNRRLCIQRKDSELAMSLSMIADLLDVHWPDEALMESVDYGQKFRAHRMPTHRATRVVWNLRREPMNEPLVRQAISLGTNRIELSNDVHHGLATPQVDLYSPCQWGARSEFISPDLHRAEALLAQAGYLKNVAGLASRPGLQLSIELLTDTSNPAHPSLAAALAQQWRVMGVTTHVVIAAHTEFAQKLADRQFEAALITEELETTWDQLAYLHSSRDKPGGLNLSGLHDRATDILLEALAQEFNPTAATARIKKLQAELQGLQPSLPLLLLEQPIAIRSTRDFSTSPDTSIGSESSWDLSRALFSLKPLSRRASP